MSTCDHICRECGQAMNCQHCHPYQLPTDRARIAELVALLREIDNKVVYGAVIHDGTADDLQRRVEAALGFGKV